MQLSLRDEGMVVVSTELENLRPQQPGKVLAISYQTTASTEAEIYDEMATVLLSFMSAVKEGWGIVHMMASMLDERGNTVGSWEIKADWVQQYVDGQISLDEVSDRILDTLNI